MTDTTVAQTSILVVDDDPDLLRLMQIRLSAAGYAVTAADSAERALAQLTIARPRLVVTDLRMSGMDGIAATRAIRHSDPRARVIIVTEHGQEQYRRAAEAAGACGFVLKENLLELPTLLAAEQRAQ